MRFEDRDRIVLALTMWRENRGGGRQGMQSIANVVINRARKNSTDPYTECIKAKQFSSMTTPGDPQLGTWPADDDQVWLDALELAMMAADNNLPDLTKGATLYYNPRAIQTTKTIVWLDDSRIPFPATWNADRVTGLASIGGHVFFAEA